MTIQDPAFDELDDDTMDYIETEDAQDVGRTSYVVHKEKESAENRVSTKDPLSTAQPKVSTDKPEDSTDKPDKGTDKPKVSTDKEEVSTDRPDKGTVDQNEEAVHSKQLPTTTTPTIFEVLKKKKHLYDKIKSSDDSFIAIGSAEDEKVIKEMNEQVADASKKRVKKDDSIKGEIKAEEEIKRKLGIIRTKPEIMKRQFTSKGDEEFKIVLLYFLMRIKEVIRDT
ncbi:hypothetical protein Tco_0703166 [Tanacetum coccineum]|uniref:Uncharacterized protein n=1 Tax=Tanacetum coccineum TaxID=301880 RepID=A0ABQ4XZ22_9ASTR